MGPHKMPSFTERAARYSRAVRRWIAAGRPVRPDAEVEQVFKTHCQPCGHYDAEKKACVICGCRVRRGGVALVNKIRMATEHCPIGEW